jgi:Raf kinase inhibitor-like YbhB/YbcL family protein
MTPTTERDANEKGNAMNIKTLVTLVAAIGATIGLAAQGQRGGAPAGPGLTLTTTAFADGAEVPPRFTQAVEMPISPRLQWTNVPPNTVTFTLIMHDPDVARQKKPEDMLHWLAFNIPGTSRELSEGVAANPQLLDGTVQGKNGGGTVGYRGPGAPAAGPHHHYTWELFALDTKLNLGPDATRDDVLKAMDGHILGKGVLVGRFHR